jgi:lipoate-protein ligase A
VFGGAEVFLPEDRDLTKSAQVHTHSLTFDDSLTMTTMGMMRMLLRSPTFTVNASAKLNGARRTLSTTSTSVNSTNTGSTGNNKIPVSWLDLRGSGLSVLERLLLEECLVRHDSEQRSWIIAGTHEPVRHRYLKSTNPKYDVITDKNEPIYEYDHSDGPNHAAVIVMGIGGKPDKLLNIKQVKADNVLVLKRFTGGGTVVLDADSIWTTVIGRPHHFTKDITESFPKPIMAYTAAAVFGPLFERLKVKQQEATQQLEKYEAEQHDGPNIVTTTQFLQMNKRTPRGESESDSASDSDTSSSQKKGKQTMVMDAQDGPEGTEVSGRSVQVVTLPVEEGDSSSDSDSSDSDTSGIPNFSLIENDYCLGQRKMGGNAQSIVKNGWLHHTSFLWDYDTANMGYLTLPDKRPAYREDRPHDDFLCKLSEAYPDLKKADFYDALKHTACEEYEVEHVTVRQALEVVTQQAGGMQAWYDKGGRTRVIEELLK